MLSAVRYSVIVVILETPLSHTNVWPAGDFDDYADAERCARSIVENVLFHLEASLRARGEEVSAGSLMTEYLREGEAPIIIGDGDPSPRFDFWAYATQRAAWLMGEQRHHVDIEAPPEIPALH